MKNNTEQNELIARFMGIDIPPPEARERMALKGRVYTWANVPDYTTDANALGEVWAKIKDDANVHEVRSSGKTNFSSEIVMSDGAIIVSIRSSEQQSKLEVIVAYIKARETQE